MRPSKKHKKKPAPPAPPPPGGRRPVGHPPVYTPELAAVICKRIAGGEYLKAICQEDGYPDADTVRSWVVNDTDGFFGLYMRAMRAQQLAAVDECREIADDSGLDISVDTDGKVHVRGEVVKRAELRIKTRQWVAERVYEKVFGNRVRVEDVTPPRPDDELQQRIKALLVKAIVSA